MDYGVGGSLWAPLRPCESSSRGFRRNRILHDLGLTTYGNGDQRFEVEGADAAALFLREQGFPDDRVTTVWQSIALHTSVGLGHRFGTEHAVCHSGIDLDVTGAQKELLPAGFADRIHAAWPRHNLGYAIAQAIARDTQANPKKAPPFSFPAHVHEVAVTLVEPMALRSGSQANGSGTHRRSGSDLRQT